MAKSVASVIQGFDYQSRLFWLHACRLFREHTKVKRVCYELDAVKSFDDVVVFYGEPVLDEQNNAITADYFQVKFHVDHSGAFTCDDLMKPAFIGATSVSLLQRLHEAQKHFLPETPAARFYIVAPWPIHPADLLGKLVENQDGGIRLDVLRRGGPRSAMGLVRSKWREHLGLDDDEELYRVLAPLKIWANAGSCASLKDRLNDKLCLAGLAPVPDNVLSHPYDELIHKLSAAGQKVFTRDILKEICEREGLWRGFASNTTGTKKNVIDLGIRSFMRRAEYMEDETDRMISLVHHFGNRNIRSPELWQRAVYPQIEEFLRVSTREPAEYHIRIDAHNSIAFAAGYCLDSKSGVNAVPVQATGSGRCIWRTSPGSTGEDKSCDYPVWSYGSFAASASGTDVAIVISVTHEIARDVQHFVQGVLPSVGRIVTCTVTPRPCGSAVLDGAHAWMLAQELVEHLRQNRSAGERGHPLHVFASSPNGLMFFLGRLGRALGPSVMYEYDFERNVPEGYQAALAFPPPSPALVSAAS